MSKVVSDKIKLTEKVIMEEIYDEETNSFDKNIVIPKIHITDLLERYKRIKPIVDLEEVYYYLRIFRFYELKYHSFLSNLEEDRADFVDITKFENIGEFDCYHGFGHLMELKVTIEDVLSQIPDELLEYANAFYVYKKPETIKDLSDQVDIVTKGCFKTGVRALTLKK